MSSVFPHTLPRKHRYMLHRTHLLTKIAVHPCFQNRSPATAHMARDMQTGQINTAIFSALFSASRVGSQFPAASLLRVYLAKVQMSSAFAGKLSGGMLASRIWL